MKQKIILNIYFDIIQTFRSQFSVLVRVTVKKIYLCIVFLSAIFHPVTLWSTVWQLLMIKYIFKTYQFDMSLVKLYDTYSRAYLEIARIWTRDRLYLCRNHRRGHSFAVPTHRTAPHTQAFVLGTGARFIFTYCKVKTIKWKSQRILTNRCHIVFPFMLNKVIRNLNYIDKQLSGVFFRHLLVMYNYAGHALTSNCKWHPWQNIEFRKVGAKSMLCF